MSQVILQKPQVTPVTIKNDNRKTLILRPPTEDQAKAKRRNKKTIGEKEQQKSRMNLRKWMQVVESEGRTSISLKRLKLKRLKNHLRPPKKPRKLIMKLKLIKKTDFTENEMIIL